MNTRSSLAFWCFIVPIHSMLLAGCDCAGYRKRTPAAETPDAGPCGADGCDCDEVPTAAGCPCDALEPERCYDADLALAGIGICQPGLRSCVDHAWSHCAGQVLPANEICDEMDNDCDGEVDDGVLSDCGDCSEDCTVITYGDGDGEIPFGADDSSSTGVEERPDGALVLEGDTFELHVLWIVNTSGDTVGKIDTELREEIARYRTGPPGVSQSPSRTSLDYRGNAFVANRAFGSVPSVTKIWERDCYDADGDARIDTSEEAGDIYEWGEDECVAWHSSVGESNGIARALAVQTRLDEAGAPEDYLWVGLYNEQRYLELDAETGEATGREVSVAPCRPYGAALDRDGRLWSGCMSTQIASFDTADLEDVEVLNQPGSNYGITVDEDGLVWTASGTCIRYDPVEEEFTSIPGCGGAGITSDGEGSIWVGGCWAAGAGAGGTCRIDREDLSVTSIAADSRGVAMDFSGQLWAISTSGWAWVVDRGDGAGDEAYERLFDDCAGAGCLGYAYTYSDMSGFQLQNATTPQGQWGTIVEGCGDGETRWVSLSWEAEAEEGTTVSFAVRGADTIEALGGRVWSTAGTAPADSPPVDFAPALGDDAGARYLEVRATLTTVRHGLSPVLHSISVQRSCPDAFR